MFHKSDWVKIEYGEYSGRYAIVTGVNLDGSYRVIPYNDKNEPESVMELDESAMSLLEPLEIRRKDLREFARAEKMYRDVVDRVFPAFNIKVRGHYKMEPQDISRALIRINRKDDMLDSFKEWFWFIQKNIFIMAAVLWQIR